MSQEHLTDAETWISHDVYVLKSISASPAAEITFLWNFKQLFKKNESFLGSRTGQNTDICNEASFFLLP